MKERLITIGRWMMERLVRTPERDNYFSAWLMLAFVIATMTSAIILAIGNPIGASFLSHALNIGRAVAINGLLFIVWTTVIGAVFSFIYLPLPRLLVASFSYTVFSTVYILINANTGKQFSYMIGFGYSLVAVIIGLLLTILFHKNVARTIKITILSIILISTSMYLVINTIENKPESIPAIAAYTGPVIDGNPALKGDYHEKFFTYGSGEDLHREEFGEAVDETTPTVDASHFITKWGQDREKFWGFGPSQLPVNGRVWLPEEEGPFPVILMVHGNHTMEYFSTSGYDYLGELLASRGFIAISVDEDFINYSNTFGIPNDNYQLRAWMFLQHLVQLQEMNETPGNSLYQKIDFDQVALAGHSRGGQAALMAADYTTFFDDEKLFTNLASVDIKAVVAIAPTDKSIQNKKPNIHNTSYLLLHGARDADLYDFRGDRQFYRTTFDENNDGFKATLYIADANHTQFNTDWGSMDLSLPRGIFLNRQQTMDPEDQRQIAKVYLSAFFERVFHGNTAYEKLFQDYRYGKDWLPDTTLVSKYRPASYHPIVEFNRHTSESINADGFTKAELMRPKDRQGQQKMRDALQLEWEKNTSYIFHVSSDDLKSRENIVFTMANVNGETEMESTPNIQVELETTDGVSVQLPLDDFMPFPPVISTNFTHFGLMDGIFREGRYKQSWEPIFQTFEIPIETFEQTNLEFEKEKINKITLHFTSQPGKILIEEIGVW